MKKSMHKIAFAASLALAAMVPGAALAAAPAAPEAPAVVPPHPKGGVLIMATFQMAPYSYEKYKNGVAAEIPIMAKNGLKFVTSYRVLSGEMDKYVDIWWAKDYDTFYKAFYAPTYRDPDFDAAVADGAKTGGTNPLQSAKIEIVEVENF